MSRHVPITEPYQYSVSDTRGQEILNASEGINYIVHFFKLIFF
jgi:hypothetical protein